MKNSKYNIREICGDWALDIQRGKETIVLIFNSRNNAEFVKKILEWEDMHPNQAVPYVPVPQPGKPLTLDQLREMDGNPTWCEEVGKWALVSVSDAGKWKGIPFALFEENGARFEWNIEGRELSLYSSPPTQQWWIPVSERLPDPLEDVLVKCKTSMGRSYECIAQYIAPGTAKDETDVEWDWEVLDYNEKRDVYVVQPGWYESVKNWDEYGLCGIFDIVTHWMPLPEPPEED